MTNTQNISNIKTIDDLKINNIYTNDVITKVFKCSKQGGMRKSNTTNTLVLISKQTGKSIYHDTWVDNMLHYTGMGQEGDQKLDFAQNRTLKDSAKNGVAVHLFEVFKDTEYTYAGIIELAGLPYKAIEPDRNNTKRIVYKFPLKLKNSEYCPNNETLTQNEEKLEKSILRKTKQEIKELAIEKSKLNKNRNLVRKVSTLIHERSPEIKEYVKELAKGICQLCDNKAPFEVKGKPFLHVHHIEYLSRGGEDTIENAIAVCPNCHAKIHQLELKEDKEKLLRKVQERNL
jgi:HNH endonuclease